MSKTLYVVRGSEDGNLGVYGSVSKAYNRAIDYVDPDSIGNAKTVEVDEDYGSKMKSASYGRVLGDLKSSGYSTIYEDEHSRTYAEIEIFYLNQ